MKVYESEGKYSVNKQSFNLTIQTTKITPDEFYISTFYNICNEKRFAIVGILQTKEGNTTDFSNYPPDTVLNIEDFSFTNLDKSYLTSDDRDIFNIQEGDEITVYIHHGIGFNPEKNESDNQYIENYKKGVYVHLEAGSPPGCKGDGSLN
ncbi:hypothetical protein [Flavobacterium sp.]|uniref:hypothetical protein n=1 Tax=Flavobacterium sp. TaxID=239 RepID=UPI0025F873F4|nr:hypothetical protein [Flavobacterium sp.]